MSGLGRRLKVVGELSSRRDFLWEDRDTVSGFYCLVKQGRFASLKLWSTRCSNIKKTNFFCCRQRSSLLQIFLGAKIFSHNYHQRHEIWQFGMIKNVYGFSKFLDVESLLLMGLKVNLEIRKKKFWKIGHSRDLNMGLLEPTPTFLPMSQA